MGAANSAPRTMTMKNEEPHIIEVTTDVINRIKHGYQPPSHLQQSAEPTTQPPPAEIVPEVTSTSTIVKEGDQERVALSVGGTKGHEVLETVSALQVRKQKDEELLANDFFWRTKLKELEGKYVASAFASQEEFRSQLDHLQKLMPELREPVCNDISPKLTACYTANPKQVLKCSDLVKEYAQCVEKHLGKTLSA